MKFADIKIPEYEANLESWKQCLWMFEGDDELTSRIPPATKDEKQESLERRQAQAVDRVQIKNLIQEQLDILHLSGLNISTDNDELNEFLTSDRGVDGQGQNLTQFVINEIIKCSLVFKQCFVVTDRAAIPEGITREEQALLEAPYSYVLNPISVPAWSYETELERDIKAILTVQMETTETDEHMFPMKTEKVWRLWTDTGVEAQNEDGDPAAEPVGNTLGDVPIFAFEHQDSLIKGLWNAVMKTIQFYSLSEAGAANQVLPFLVIKTIKNLQRVDVGPTQGLQLDPGDDATMLSSPIEGVEFNKTTAEDCLAFIKQQFRQKIISMGQAAVEQSGVSKRRDQDSQEAFSKYLATEAVRAAKQLIPWYARFMGIADGSFEVVVDMPTEFVVQDRIADLAEAKYLSLEYEALSKQSFITQQKRIRRLSGIEDAMTPEEIDADNADIEEVAEARFADDEPLEENDITPEPEPEQEPEGAEQVEA